MKPKLLRFLPLSLVLLASASAQDTPPVTPPATPTPATPAQAPVANPAADLAAAAERLATANSYTWSQTSSFGGNFGDRTTSGKKGSGGYMLVTVPGRDQEVQVLTRKGKAAMLREGTWVVPNPDAEGQGQGQGGGRWIARMVQNLREPTADAKDLAAKAKDLKLENGSYKGTLDEAAAKELMSFRGFGRRGGGGGGGGGQGGGGGGGGGGGTPPEVTGASGTVSFTVTDGVLTGYELNLTGRMNFNGEDRDVNRTTKVSFTAVCTTTFDIPEAAAGLLAE